MSATLPQRSTPSGTVVAIDSPRETFDVEGPSTPGLSWYSEPGKPMLVGLSHKTAPVEVRERLSIPQKEWNAAAERLCAYPGIREASILSTCNRFEVYVVPENPFAIESDVMSFLCEKSGMKTEELQP